MRPDTVPVVARLRVTDGTHFGEATLTAEHLGNPDRLLAVVTTLGALANDRYDVDMTKATWSLIR